MATQITVPDELAERIGRAALEAGAASEADYLNHALFDDGNASAAEWKKLPLEQRFRDLREFFDSFPDRGGAIADVSRDSFYD